MGCNEMGIMLPGCTDACVAQKFLHRADVGALRQQFDREGVPEAVRAGMNLGYFPQTLNGTAHVLDTRHQVSVSGPEEVLGVDRRQSIECFRGIVVQQNLQPHTGLENLQHQMAGAFECRSAELGHIGNPEPAIKENQHQGRARLRMYGVSAGSSLEI